MVAQVNRRQLFQVAVRRRLEVERLPRRDLRPARQPRLDQCFCIHFLAPENPVERNGRPGCTEVLSIPNRILSYTILGGVGSHQKGAMRTDPVPRGTHSPFGKGRETQKQGSREVVWHPAAIDETGAAKSHREFTPVI